MAETTKKTAKPAATKAKTAAKPKAAAKSGAAAKPKAEKATPKPVAAPEPAVKAATKPARERKPRAEGVASSRTSSRKVREGLVVSNKMAKTVVVLIERRTQHPLYGKVVIRSNKFKAHDEVGCDIGDRVEIMETRPLSRDKRWRVTQILEKVK